MRRVAMTLVALLALGCGDTAGESSGSTSADDTTGEDGVAGADVPADDVTEPPDVPDTSEPEDAPASEDVLEYDAAGDPDVPINSDADSVDVPPDAGPGPGCCAGEGDCDDGQCVTSAGICKPDPEEGACWEASDCSGGQACVGATVCPCGQVCPPVPDAPGICQTLEPGCCATDDDCADEKVCANQVGPGECIALAEGQCMDDGDCATGSCEGAIHCPCNTPCFAPTMPGTCTDEQPQPGCCKTDLHCGPDQVCAAVQGVPPNQSYFTCAQELATEGQCWDDGDCGPEETCEGETLCPCGLACAVANTPGTCQSSGPCDGFTQPGCLESGCGEGEYCDGDVGCVSSSCYCDPETGDVSCTDDCGGGTCVPVDLQSECTADEDCDGEETCQAGTYCYHYCTPDDPSCCIGNTCEEPAG